MQNIYSKSLILLLFFLAACATSPPDLPPVNWLGIFPEDSSILFSVKPFKHVRSIVESILKDNGFLSSDIKSLLKNTKEIYGSIKIQSGKPIYYSFALLGLYHSPCLEIGMDLSKGWYKDKKTHRFWHQKEGHLKISHPVSYLILLSNHDMNILLSQIKSPHKLIMAPEIENIMEKGDATFLITRFGQELIPGEIPINTKRLPIREVWLNIAASTEGFSLNSSFNLINNENAELFTTSFKTFVIWLMRNAKIIKFTDRIDIKTYEAYVKIISTSFSENEIKNMLNVLLNNKNEF